MGLMHKLPWGRVCTKQVKQHDERGKIVVTTVPYFRGNPEKFVQALIDKHHSPSACLAIIHSQIKDLAVPSAFYNQCQGILNKILLKEAGKTKAESHVGRGASRKVEFGHFKELGKAKA